MLANNWIQGAAGRFTIYYMYQIIVQSEYNVHDINIHTDGHKLFYPKEHLYNKYENRLTNVKVMYSSCT